MAHPINVVLLVLGILQGILLGLFLLRKQKTDLAGIYFLLLLALVGLQLTFKTLSKVWLMQNVHLPYSMSYNLPFLVGPFLYGYVRAIAGRRFQPNDLLHAFPFVVFIGVDALHNFLPFRFHAFHVDPYVAAALRVGSIALYAGLAWHIARINKLDFLKPFVGIVASAETIISITMALMYVHFPAFPDVRWLFVTLTILVYWISYRVMESRHRAPETWSSESLPRNTKYDRSGLKPDEALAIANRLKQIMVEKQLFMDSGLTIDLLAKHLNTSRHYLSQVINENFDQSYHEYVNEFRLVEARARLESGLYGHYTISAIALDCGFSSVSNFNELFKKRFRQTPSQVRPVIVERIIS